MEKYEVTWLDGDKKNKTEDVIRIEILQNSKESPKTLETVEDVVIPARKFADVSEKGMRLLRDHHYGAFINEKDVSLVVRLGHNDAEGLVIASIFVRDLHVTDIWCDQIICWGIAYTMSHKGISVGSVTTNQCQ